MKYIISVLTLLVLIACFHDSIENTRGRKRSWGKKTRRANRARSHTYRRFLKANKELRKMYLAQYNTTIARKQGKCKMTPAWSINGKYPVIDEANKGNAVFLFTMKSTCGRCWHELRSLHRWARYYKAIGEKAKIIVLMHKGYGTYPQRIYRQYYPYINVYDEPKDQDIFSKLKAGFYNMLMYDQCGRHQYHYKLPFSSMVKPYVRMAMRNTISHYQTLCGICNSTISLTTPTPYDVPPTEKKVTIMGPA